MTPDSLARPDLVITPEPSPAELAAIVAVLAATMAGADAELAAAPAPAPTPAWRLAALREGVAGIGGGPRTGWGRTHAGRTA